MHLDVHAVKIQDVKFNMDFVKMCLRVVTPLDHNWTKFPFHMFDKDKYKAHEEMYETLKEEVDRLMEEYAKKAKAKQEAKEKEAREKEARDKAAAVEKQEQDQSPIQQKSQS